jgi:uncharacterized protein (TIGR02145 family)
MITVDCGDNKTFTFTPDTNYEIDQVLVDGTNNPAAVTAGSFTFTNVTGNHTIYVTFKQMNVPTHTIYLNIGENGSVGGSTTGTYQPGSYVIEVEHGTNWWFLFTCDYCYIIDSVVFNGIHHEEIYIPGFEGYTFYNITEDITIYLAFKFMTFTITATQTPNGTITPTATVGCAADTIYSITPNKCYEIDQVWIDGELNSAAAAAGFHKFEAVKQNHTITATFKAKAPYIITASAGENGIIDPEGEITVICGENQTFTFTPNTNYEINQVLIDGTNNPAAVAAGEYTFTDVNANHTIHVTFKFIVVNPIIHSIIATVVGGNGTITPQGTVWVSHGENQTFTFAPATCYEIDKVLVNGAPVAVTGNSYTFTNVITNHTISVSYKRKVFTITASANAGGTITPSGNITVLCGNNQTFTFEPIEEHYLDRVIVDGVQVSVTGDSYTFNNVTANHTITVYFKIIKIHDCPEEAYDAVNDYTYPVVPLVGLCWFGENFRGTKYADETDIPFAQPYTCAACPEGLEDIFGLLYTWYSAVNDGSGRSFDVQGVCPEGWRIPTEAEWNLLSAYDATELRSAGFWIDPPGAGTDIHDFDARPAGWYNGAINQCVDLYGFAGWWASDEQPESLTAKAYTISYYCNLLQKTIHFKPDGLSVRCVME